jgi:hypothetical protein
MQAHSLKNSLKLSSDTHVAVSCTTLSVNTSLLGSSSRALRESALAACTTSFHINLIVNQPHNHGSMGCMKLQRTVQRVAWHCAERASLPQLRQDIQRLSITSEIEPQVAQVH